MSLSAGTRLGPYEILSALGAGGMGEVYRAKDTNLDRDVAIKVLPESFALDADRVARFTREAKTLAALNHPNIASIYGIEAHALVMELVEGEDLSERIAHGAIPLDGALPIAKQIAEALEAAHEQGIIHRDLKPANIKVRADGTVKVLDFGLAKAMDPAGASSADAMNSPTLTARATQMGTILGTAAYMSPEQARGHPVDKRADIWAFGCVLYEMLTGTRAFGGDEMTDTLAFIITKEPDSTALPAGTPAAIRRLLRRCLDKDRKRRLADIADARIEIDEALAEPVTRSSDGANAGTAPWRTAAASIPTVLVAAWLLSALIAGGATALWFSGRSTTVTTASPPVARLDLNLPSGVELFSGTSHAIAFSSDGSRVAFVGVAGGVRQVYVRRLDDFATSTLPIRGAEGVNQIFFSPDGRALGFTSSNGGSLKTISIADGLIVPLTEGVDVNAGGTWGADNRITFTRANVLWQIPVGGGTATAITTLDKSKGEIAHRWPIALGDGSRILFTVISGTDRDASRIEAIVMPSKDRRVIESRATFPLYTPSGHLMFFRDNAIVVARFDTGRLAVGDTLVKSLEDVAVDSNGVPMAAVSAAGALAYASRRSATSQLIWASRRGGEESLTDTPGRYFNPRLSPDGQKVVVTHDGDLWIQDVGRKVFTKLTSDATTGNSYAAWTRDGLRVVYRTLTGLFWMAVDGSGRSQAVPGTSVSDYPNSVAPDNSTLAFIHVSAERSGDIYTLSLKGDPDARPLVANKEYEGGPQISPNGRWLLYVSDKSGQFEVFLQPFPGPGGEVQQVSTHGGTQARWNPNGREVFYRDGNKMLAVDVALDPATSRMKLVGPHVLFEQRYAFGLSLTTPNYDVGLDGERFLMVKDESDAGQLHIVLNWTDELKQRVPVK